MCIIYQRNTLKKERIYKGMDATLFNFVPRRVTNQEHHVDYELRHQIQTRLSLVDALKGNRCLFLDWSTFLAH